MVFTAVKDARASSRELSGKTSRTRVETVKTARLTNASVTAASTAAIRSVWPWA